VGAPPATAAEAADAAPASTSSLLGPWSTCACGCNGLDNTGLQFTFTPGVWAPRLVGSSGLKSGGHTDDIVLRDDLKLDDFDPIFNAEVSMRRNNLWQIKAGGFAYSIDSEGRFDGSADFGGLSLHPGDHFRASFDLTSFNAEMTYWFWHTCSCTGTQLQLGATAGFAIWMSKNRGTHWCGKAIHRQRMGGALRRW